jgi:hypothetical protein
MDPDPYAPAAPPGAPAPPPGAPVQAPDSSQLFDGEPTKLNGFLFLQGLRDYLDSKDKGIGKHKPNECRSKAGNKSKFSESKQQSDTSDSKDKDSKPGHLKSIFASLGHLSDSE